MTAEAIVAGAEALAGDIVARAEGRARFCVALAGPPGAGKSTLAEALGAALEARCPGEVAVVPMDGFHYDDGLLVPWGLRPRKGAPETFDTGGLAAALERIRTGDAPVAVPVFDRSIEIARAGARIVEPRHRIVVVEGNYLLLDEAPWRDLARQFDMTIRLDVPESVLRERLVRRWLDHGFAQAEAEVKAEGNDLPNARRVLAASLPATVSWPGA